MAYEADFLWLGGKNGAVYNGTGGNIVVLDDLKHHSKTVGLKQTLKALAADKVRVLFIAQDAEERVISKVMDACRDKNIEIYKVDTMKLLGRKCGIDVGTAVAAIIKD